MAAGLMVVVSSSSGYANSVQFRRETVACLNKKILEAPSSCGNVSVVLSDLRKVVVK